MVRDTTRLGLLALGAAAALGLLGDLLLRATPWGLNAPVWIAALLLVGGVLARRAGLPLLGEARWLGLAALFFAAGVAWRDSQVLLAVNLLAVILTLGLAAHRGRPGWPLIGGLPQYLGALMSAGIHACGGVLVLAAYDVRWKEVPRTGWSSAVLAGLRGLLIAIPLLLVFGALFMAADAVFSGIVGDVLAIDVKAAMSHLFWFGVWSWLTAGILRQLLFCTLGVDGLLGADASAARSAVPTVSRTADAPARSMAGPADVVPTMLPVETRHPAWAAAEALLDTPAYTRRRPTQTMPACSLAGDPAEATATTASQGSAEAGAPAAPDGANPAPAIGLPLDRPSAISHQSSGDLADPCGLPLSLGRERGAGGPSHGPTSSGEGHSPAGGEGHPAGGEGHPAGGEGHSPAGGEGHPAADGPSSPGSAPAPRPGGRVGWLGIVELGVILGLLDALFLAFVVVQFRYLFGGATLVAVSDSLTYAEYARRGFFELVAVAALLLPIVLFLDWLARLDRPRDRQIYRALAGLLVVLLVVVIVSALQRMRLYTQEYGLTELRLYTTAFMLWITLGTFWYLATVLRDHRERFLFGAIVAGLVVAATLDAIDPDNLIVRSNAARLDALDRFDGLYTALLSDDAVPALIDALPAIPEYQRVMVARRLISRWESAQARDWRSWNYGRWRAAMAISRNEELLRQIAELKTTAPSIDTRSTPEAPRPPTPPTAPKPGPAGKPAAPPAPPPTQRVTVPGPSE